MRLPFPLFGQIVVWLGLNFLVVAVVVALLVGYPVGGAAHGSGWESILGGPLGDRPQALAGAIAAELGQAEGGKDDWDVILRRWQADENVSYAVWRPEAGIVAGELTLPPEVLRRLAAMPLQRRPDGPPPRRRQDGDRAGEAPNRLEEFGIPGAPPANLPGGQPGSRQRDRRGPPGGPQGGPDDRPGGGPPSQGQRPELAGPRVLVEVTGDGYWMAVPVSLPNERPGAPNFAVLVARAGSFTQFVMYTGLSRSLPVAAALLLASALLWWPLVRSITSALRRLTRVTEQIAAGKLDARADIRGRDEIGRLGAAVNHMAGRLERLVKEERRFLGDIAHELGSPLGRMQLALGLIERKLQPGGESNLADLREDVDQMAALVGELLAFSKASTTPRQAASTPVSLVSCVRAAVSRERADSTVKVMVSDDVVALGAEDLITRAVANLVRNAVRYAGNAEVTCLVEESYIILRVTDEGPGVPESALPRLGDPFYRPEAARSRETGGVGLGLAIVRTCVEACGGTVQFSNRSPQGFQADLRLRRAT